MKPERDSTFERILDRQARLWESQQVHHPPEQAPVRPNLAISQPACSGGRELAERLAIRLGWELYDRRIVEALHEHDALGRSVLESLDEHLLAWREDWIYHLFVPGHTSATAYIQRLSRLVFSIAMRGHAIFVGRGAGCIIPQENRLDVLVTSSFKMRQELWLAQHGGTPEQARHELVRLDRERGEFIARSFHRDIDQPLSHDLCVNLETLGPDASEALVLGALQSRFPQLQRAPVG
jgi:cytidylate kinase